MNLNRVNSVLVTNVGGANTGNTLATIAEGDVLVLNALNAVLSGSPTMDSQEGNEAIYIALGIPLGVQDGDKTMRISHTILGRNITGWKKQPFTAPVQQEAFIGFNGVGNALSLKDSTEYRMRLTLKERHTFRPHRQSQFDYYYNTGQTADNYAGASSLASKLNIDNRVLRKMLEAKVIQDGGTITEFTADATVINGTKILNTVGHGTSANDFIILRDSIYKVARVIDANNIELDRPYGGISETIVVGATTDQAGTITGITSYGLNIVAKPMVTRKVDLYQQISFTVNLAPVNGVIGEEEQISENAAILGEGYWEQIRDLEFFEAGMRGITNRIDFPVDDFSPIAKKGSTYVQYTIEHYDEVNTGHGIERNPLVTILAFDTSVATTKADVVESILDSYMQSTGLAAV